MRWRLKSPASQLFTQPFIRAQIKESIKAPRHWPLCGEFTGGRWIPRTTGQLRGKCFHLMTSSCLTHTSLKKWALCRGYNRLWHVLLVAKKVKLSQTWIEKNGIMHSYHENLKSSWGGGWHLIFVVRMRRKNRGPSHLVLYARGVKDTTQGVKV